MYTIYTQAKCPLCVHAKTLFETKKIPYTPYELNVDIRIEDFIALYPHVRTMPLVLEDDKIIGGFAELKKHLEMKNLEGMSL